MNASSPTPPARHGTIDARDIELMHRTDSVDDTYEWIVRQLAEKALGQSARFSRPARPARNCSGRLRLKKRWRPERVAIFELV